MKLNLKSLVLISLFAFLFLRCNTLYGQKKFVINGHFPNFPNSSFELKGFDGFQEQVLFKTISDEEGKFILNYTADYTGVAQLFMNGSYATLLFLNQENYQVYWEDLTKREDIQITGSKEYEAFIKGMKTFQDAEAKLAGWHYLLPLYKNDSIKQKWVATERNEVATMFPNYVKSIPEKLLVRQYLLTKGLIEQMPNTVQTYNWRVSQHISEFTAIDFKSLKHTGLLKDAIEGYTNLLERFPIEEVYPLLEQTIDKVIFELKDSPALQQEVAQKWFTYLESHSLFKSAEYLALKMLNDQSCKLNDKSTLLFEQYRKMAVGKIAPDISLNGKKLKDLKNKHILVIFGASWCPNCQSEYPKLKDNYTTLKEKYDVEIVYIAVDTVKPSFEAYYKDAPFPTFCDARGWETQAAKDYHIFATPTMFLLDKDLKIMLKPISVEQVYSYLEYDYKR